MRKHLLALLVILSITNGFSAVSYFFSVEFANKNGTPYTLINPSEYLTARSIARRASFGISIDSTDLPVNKSYLAVLKDSGLVVHSVSKWLNRATIYTTDSSIINVVKLMPFVKSTQFTGKLDPINLAPHAPLKSKAETIVTDYTGDNQINEINGKYLHNQGYTGKGMYIGVLDGGFLNVHINPGFDSLRLQGRLLKAKNIAHPGRTVYQGDNHGALVLSTMAGNLVSSGTFRGTAPHADYCLIITEVGGSESLFETDFWVSGIEYADSLGVDIINSSLGYHTFDIPSLNYNYSQMTGKVIRSSIAATMAAHKGIVVTVSQGNDALKTWKYLSSPADADEVFAVGGLQSGIPSTFSSYGPSYDGRIKPDICAKATSTTLIETNGTISCYQNGTSFASPIIAGMLACLMQHYKQMNPNPNLFDFRQAVIKSGSLYSSPTEQMGYGLANFMVADDYLKSLSNVANNAKDKNELLSIRQSGKELILMKTNGNFGKNMKIRIHNSSGALIYSRTLTDDITYTSLPSITSGIYLINIFTETEQNAQKIAFR